MLPPNSSPQTTIKLPMAPSKTALLMVFRITATLVSEPFRTTQHAPRAVGDGIDPAGATDECSMAIGSRDPRGGATRPRKLTQTGAHYEDTDGLP
jgi:hypothetical protein